VFARKPLVGTVAANVLAHGTGALNIDGCRIGTSDTLGRVNNDRAEGSAAAFLISGGKGGTFDASDKAGGRWPANVVLDADQAATLNQQSGEMTGGSFPGRQGSQPGSANGTMGGGWSGDIGPARKMDTGGASRFFYVAKAPTVERPKQGGIAHPTVKPIDLMQWLIRLVTPPGGVVLDPFAGSGTTGEATIREGFTAILIEREAEYLPLIRERFRRPINYVLDFGDPA
jgi:site-specific DNA-methyltransferase (adenine-specific)